MCYGCWEEKGKPQIDTPEVRAAAATIEPLYALCCTGGAMHIFTDDWNIEDSHLKWCGEMIGHHSVWDKERQCWLDTPEINNPPDDPEELAVQRACFDAFVPLSEEERLSALALAGGFWGGN